LAHSLEEETKYIEVESPKPPSHIAPPLVLSLPTLDSVLHFTFASTAIDRNVAMFWWWWWWWEGGQPKGTKTMLHGTRILSA